ncbi:hypothetical protein OG554_03560 [Streptomyces griseus]|uniref:hypothetical protein n=1 Tax=Streptomyces griseus TaxID=1911 RepID=UPI00386D82A5|nr:hypothetical protein OG554_03560 [Streptomyces fimicarius]
MTYTLADAIRAQFERDHPGGKNTLKCTSCYRRADREEFRELPTHGRAPACMRCEGRSWRRYDDARTRWELEQAREKLRMYQRYAQRLRAERYDGPPMRIVSGMGSPSGAYFPDREAPWRRLVEARRQKWAPVIAEALNKAHTLSQEEA